MGPLIIFAILWIALSILGEILLARIKPHTMYHIASTQGFMAHNAFNFLATFLLPIYLFVVLLLFYVLFGFHAPNGKAEQSASQSTRNPLFTGIWVTTSIVVNILFWLHPTAADLEQMFAKEQASANHHDIVVNVTARQWEWIFSYPQYGIKQAVNKSGQDELVLPVGRRVKFALRSYDPFHTYDIYAGVIHDFWIPAFGIKEAIIPGMTRYEYTRPTQIMNFHTTPMARVQCAEVCGPGHPWMEAPMKVVSKATFHTWVKKQLKLQGG